MTLGLYIGRLNPPHIGHIGIIEKALKENQKTIILLGSHTFQDEKNPLNFEQRKNILKKKFGNNKKLIILELIDDESDLVWIYAIYKYLYEKGDNIKNINFYVGDMQNDSAYLVLKENEKILSDYNINYINIYREKSYIKYKGEKYDISATNLRKALRDKNYDLATMFCDKEIFEEIKKYFI